MKIAPTSPSADVLNNGSGVIFNVDPITGNGYAGGVLNYVGNGGSTEVAGILTGHRGCGRRPDHELGEHVELWFAGDRTAAPP